MDVFHIVLLAIVQGITEFLPVSSSAHLALMPYLVGAEDQGLAYDVAIHMGSLLAVTLYFRRDLAPILLDSTRRFIGRQQHTDYSRLGKHLVLATIPIVIIGAMLYELALDDLRNPLVMAAASIIFGLLLWYADLRGKRERNLASMSVTDALMIGLLQALAIIPGTSRSGITITAGLLLGFNRREASRFSFLLAIPTIFLSGVLVSYKLLQAEASFDWPAMLLGAILSFVFAWLAIHYFLKLIEKTGMLPYVIYRIILGGLLLVIFL
jgi:undecaprenyl-diphosphatase